MSEEEITKRKSVASELKLRGNRKFWYGYIKEAVKLYTKPLHLCSLKMVKERIVLHSNMSQCYLLLKKTEEATISDTTRALCLSGINVHQRRCSLDKEEGTTTQDAISVQRPKPRPFSKRLLESAVVKTAIHSPQYKLHPFSREVIGISRGPNCRCVLRSP
ncbi:hypothetical protein Ddye_025931 [Dipteronia dyeriana]|uniref:Uncharacterized protein n=1 Tax=Dipteronia dyeriana TaxID=168575 RepID=A0AAD9TLS1_9ROSI|nr:hypothetical protein Ddye_025931 [Dipteronia dyeriana]